ncbi:Cof-type HAD-IIB family hydrolase [Enterococcus alcedinis]|uniref:Haloacid dehalogenase n=1 Tax=Enterococcus alcedinis TaxID=1274384 RepID=A0A917N5G8_9ENTE|nr:Cof-type HAD-IIB family hydrolase [Enterococcus alcedinis]MBP2103134.1 Cof subfamily protein (haloacid dehalogenase superfamily) [Enterococcus alcedinis]GGI66725.1 haloacid dehalogenase [Enterococcus alcedinis]
MTIKAIVLDIDGTLLADNKEMRASTITSLKTAQENGIKVLLASGRPHRGMESLADALELDKHEGFVVSYNGAKVTNWQTKEVIFNQALTAEEGRAILEHLKQFDVIPMIEKDAYMFVNDVFNNRLQLPELGDFNIIEYESRGGNFKLQEIDDLAQHVDFELNKILIAGQPEYLAMQHEKIYAPFVNQANAAFSAPFYYEMTAKGIDKARALKETLQPLGIEAHHIIAFGDGENDLTMLKYAGTGVVMENANDKVKQHADFITASNNQDGIYQALKKYLPELIN